MATIYWNDQITDTSVEVITLKQDDLEESQALIRENYLNGNIVVIEDFRIPIDLEIFEFNSLPQLPNYGSIPDYQYNFFKTYFKKPRKTEKVIEKIYGDSHKAVKLRKEMNLAQEYVFNILANIFDSKLIYKYEPFSRLNLDISTWRFTDTVKSGYHIDEYPGINFRAFWNLSDNPRVWGFGHKINDIIQLKIDEVVRFMKEPKNISSKGFIHFHQREFNAYLNNFLNEFPTHRAEFNKYDLWICDSLKVAHQVISGDKMAGFTYPLMNNVWKVSQEIHERLDYNKYVLKFLASHLKGKQITKKQNN